MSETRAPDLGHPRGTDGYSTSGLDGDADVAGRTKPHHPVRVMYRHVQKTFGRRETLETHA